MEWSLFLGQTFKIITGSNKSFAFIVLEQTPIKCYVRWHLVCVSTICLSPKYCQAYYGLLNQITSVSFLFVRYFTKYYISFCFQLILPCLIEVRRHFAVYSFIVTNIVMELTLMTTVGAISLLIFHLNMRYSQLINKPFDRFASI